MDRTQHWVIELEEQPEPPSSPIFDSPRWSDTESGTQRVGGLRLSQDTALTFVKKRGRYTPLKRVKLRNSLLAAVGFLELANAGDFAANVWNTVPVPIHAAVLMGLGGTLAIGMLYFVVRDSILSWQNVCGLRAERRVLHEQRRQHQEHEEMLRAIDCCLDVNFREMGTELVDRIGMDVLMGVGALVVGVGTYLAIDGNHPTSYYVSNLLTGYIGNSPCALYGIINLCWSAYVWSRARRLLIATTPGIRGTRLENMMKMRISNLQFHSSLNGITGIVAGVASLVTATQWWGYVVLLPCLVTSGLVNLFWRRRVGYDRPFVLHETFVDEDSLLDALNYVEDCRRRVENATSDAVTVLVPESDSLPAVLDWITKNHLFEDFCLRLVQDVGLTTRLFPNSPESVTVDLRTLAMVEDESLVCRLRDLAKSVINEAAPRCFSYQERHLLETYGCYVAILKDQAIEKRNKEQGTTRTPHNRHRNAHTDCGRHGSDWLFGGFSFTKTVKQLSPWQAKNGQ
ncbi:hypothetical protein QBC46DRAFT_385922 [Diplogelasinospora grovesii]|uniref:Integral membrane protein n=1 Tax=Diplogelasinospora grovesii TaxID=303347 RepID=A0AAN6S4K0_9PEZI|nr:hypothetical protein QBC46DRAFT_385922 [Diplogelasinospora grovesii]